MVVTLGRWAVEWLYDDIRFDDVDAVTLAWWMHRRVDPTYVPPGRVVVRFDHTAPERQTVWIVLERGSASVCTNHPRLDDDVVVTCPTPVLARVFLGADSWSGAQRVGTLRVDGRRELTRNVSRWFQPSPFSDDVRRVIDRRAGTDRPVTATAS